MPDLSNLRVVPRTVASTTTVADVRRLLYEDLGLPGVVVLDDDEDARWLAAEVLLRTPVRPQSTIRDIRCCPPTVLHEAAGLSAAVAHALGRPEQHGGHPVLVDTADGIRLLAVRDLLASVGRQLRRGLMIDPLTGLASRASVTAALDAMFDDAHPGTTIAVAFLDLDRFKEVNDRHGHAVGDRVLDVVGRRLGHAVRGSDVVGRMGGDEFLAIFQVADAEEARAAGERLVERVEEPIDQGLLRLDVGLSVGIAVGTVGRDRPDQLLADADALMYLAKQRGGGVLVSHESGDTVVTRSQLEVALADDQLELFYQPIVPLDGTPFTDVEALVRWRRADGTILSPDSFIPLAEATGQIVELDWWALRTAVEQLTVWDAHTPLQAPWSIHVNLSARTLVVPGVVSHVARTIDVAGIDPARLTLEVTETAVIRNLERAAAVLTSLQELGVHASIDDFGVGESSLAQLTSLPVSSLKIDRSFIERLAERDVDRSVVRVIQTLATELGLDVVAEGVESQAQAEALQALGVTHAQGWLWSPALDSHRVRDLQRTTELQRQR